MSNLGQKQAGTFESFQKQVSEPPACFAPHEFWFWEQTLDDVGVKPVDMARELYEKGFNPGYAHARENYAVSFGRPEDCVKDGKPLSDSVRPLSPGEWLSDRWFEEIGHVMAQAKEDGSCFAVADEYGWPSLQAGGRVLREYPDMFARSLSYNCIDLKRGESTILSRDGFYVAGKLVCLYPSDYVEYPEGDWKRLSFFTDESKPHQPETRPYNGGARCTDDVSAWAEYHPCITKQGEYDLFATWCRCGENTTDAVYTVVNGEKRTEIHVDQTEEALTWKRIGRVFLEKGAYITVRSAAGGVLCVDAIRLDLRDTRIVIDDMDTLKRTRAVFEPGSLRLVEDGPFCAENGDYRIYTFSIVPMRGYDGSQVDNLDTRLAERFARLAYDPYFEKLSKYMGHSGPCQGFFADTEGGFGFRLAWSNDLEKRYQVLSGRPLRADLPLMMDESADGLETIVRCAWYEAASDIFAGQFAHQTRLCAAHDMYFTMHTWEESMPFQANQVGSYFKLNRAISLPGTDALLNVAYNAANFWDTLSVAEFEDRRYMVEMMALERPDLYDFRELTRQINYLAAWGASHIITHSLKMTRVLAQDVVTPDFYNIDPGWKHMKRWTDYVRRISFIDSWGHIDAHALLLHPMECIWASTEGANMDPGYDMWAESGSLPAQAASHGGEAAEVNRIYQETIRALTHKRIGFLTADSEYIRRMSVSNGNLHYRHWAFDTVVVPYTRIIDQTVMRRLSAFSRQGGRVIFLGRLPDGSPQAGTHDPLVSSLAVDILTGGKAELRPECDIPSDIDPCLSFEAGAYHMLALPRRIGNRLALWVANNDDEAHCATIRIHNAAGRVTCFDPMTGESYDTASHTDGPDTICRVELEAIEGRFLFIHPGQTPSSRSEGFDTLGEVHAIRPEQVHYPPQFHRVHIFGDMDAEGLRIIVRRMPEGYTANIKEVVILAGETEVARHGSWQSTASLAYENCQCLTIPFCRLTHINGVRLKGAAKGLPSEYRIEALHDGIWKHVLTYNDGAPTRWPDRAAAHPIAEMDYLWQEAVPLDATHILVQGVTQSAELFINDQSAGVRISAPYLFQMDGLLHSEENRFRLRITGTLTRDAALSGKIFYVHCANDKKQ